MDDLDAGSVRVKREKATELDNILSSQGPSFKTSKSKILSAGMLLRILVQEESHSQCENCINKVVEVSLHKRYRNIYSKRI